MTAVGALGGRVADGSVATRLKRIGHEEPWAAGGDRAWRVEVGKGVVKVDLLVGFRLGVRPGRGAGLGRGRATGVARQPAVRDIDPAEVWPEPQLDAVPTRVGAGEFDRLHHDAAGPA